MPAPIAPGESAVSNIETNGVSVQALLARVPLNVAGAELWPGSSVPNDVGEPSIVMPGADVVSAPVTSPVATAPVLEAAVLTQKAPEARSRRRRPRR